LYLEEKPYLKPLPVQNFRFFVQGTRTVDDAGLVQVERSYYAAAPAPLFSEVTVRIYEREIEILDEHGQVLRRHEKTTRPGDYRLPEEDRIFNPSRETARLIGKVAKIGPHCAQLAREIFARLGRPGQHAIYGLSNLTRHHRESVRTGAHPEHALLPGSQAHPGASGRGRRGERCRRPPLTAAVRAGHPRHRRIPGLLGGVLPVTTTDPSHTHNR